MVLTVLCKPFLKPVLLSAIHSELWQRTWVCPCGDSWRLWNPHLIHPLYSSRL